MSSVSAQYPSVDVGGADSRAGVVAVAAQRLEGDFRGIERAAKKQSEEQLIAPAVFMVVLIVALVVASSGPEVVLYAVGVVGGVTLGVGFLAIRHLLAAIRAEATTLGEVARLLVARPDPGALEAHLHATRESGSAEALQQVLLAAQGERPGTTAPPAFVRVEAGLDRVGFMRNGVVLLGLFGTVLFFTVSLAGDRQLTAATLGGLLTAVRGALACTMAGIAASLALGFAASRAAALYDELVQATGALLNGPVTVVAAAAPVRRTVHTEAELWEQVLAQVEAFTRHAADAQKSMGDGVHAHVKALEKLAEKLESAPAFHVPEGVGHFAPAAERFEHGVSLLHQAVDTLVGLVARVSVQAPVASLERLGGIEALQKKMEERTLQAVADTHADLLATSTALSGVADEVTALRADRSVSARLEQLAQARDEAEQRITSQLAEVQKLARGAAESAAAAESLARQVLAAPGVDQRPLTERLDLLMSGQAAEGRTLAELMGKVRAVASRVDPLAKDLQRAGESHAILAAAGEALRETVQGANAGADELRQGLRQVAATTVAMRTASDRVAAGAAAIQAAAAEIRDRGTGAAGPHQHRHDPGEQEALLRRIEAKITRGFAQLAPLMVWQRRMSSAPLVRLLSIPLPARLSSFLGWMPSAEPAGDGALALAPPPDVLRGDWTGPPASPSGAPRHAQPDSWTRGAREPAALPAPLRGAREAARESPPGFDEAAVREVYAEWVRRRPQPPPTFPPDWEVVPLRFARHFQEHAAARPVLFFTDAGQVVDFVRFSPAGADNGFVLPHPEAAHSVEMVNLLFPSLDAPGLGRADTLTRLAPVPVRRNGQFWEVQH